MKDILTGDPKAGETYFTGDGKCTTCHSATGDLAGIASHLGASRCSAAHALSERPRWPWIGAGLTAERGDRERDAGVGRPQSGVLLEEDDFHVTFRDASGGIRVVRKAAGVKVDRMDPLQAHHELLDRITDKNIHDLVAYLETLK